MSRDFVKISPNFWTGKTGRDLRRAGMGATLVAMYLLTCPSANYIGIFRLPMAYMAADLGIDAERAREYLREVEYTGFCKYDAREEIVWVIEGARHQLGELKAGDNKVKMCQKDFDRIPVECSFLREYFNKYRNTLHLKAHKDWTDADQVEEPVRVEAAKPTPVHIMTTVNTKKTAEPATVEVEATDVVSDAPDWQQDSAKRANDALMNFLELRDEAGKSTPAGDRRVTQTVLHYCKHTGGYGDIPQLLEIAVEAGDYDLANFEEHLRTASRRYADDI